MITVTSIDDNIVLSKQGESIVCEDWSEAIRRLNELENGKFDKQLEGEIWELSAMFGEMMNEEI